MSHKSSGEISDGPCCYKVHDFNKINSDGLKQSTKYKSVRTLSYKKLSTNQESTTRKQESTDLVDILPAKCKLMVDEVPKYIDGDNHKKYLRKLICNAEYILPEDNQNEVENVERNKLRSGKMPKKSNQSGKLKMKYHNFKPKNAEAVPESMLESTKRAILKNSKRKIKPLQKIKILVEEMATKTKVSRIIQPKNKPEKIANLKNQNSVAMLIGPKGKYRQNSDFEEKYISHVVKKLENSANASRGSTKRSGKETIYKSKTTIVTPTSRNDQFCKSANDREQDRANLLADKAKLLEDILLLTKKYKKLPKNSDSKKDRSKHDNDDYLPYTSPPLRLKSKPSLRGKAEQKYVEDDYLPYTSPPLTITNKTANFLSKDKIGMSMAAPQDKSTEMTCLVKEPKRYEIESNTDITENTKSKQTNQLIEKKSGISEEKCFKLPDHKMLKIKKLTTVTTSFQVVKKESSAKYMQPVEQAKELIETNEKKIKVSENIENLQKIENQPIKKKKCIPPVVVESSKPKIRAPIKKQDPTLGRTKSTPATPPVISVLDISKFNCKMPKSYARYTEKLKARSAKLPKKPNFFLNQKSSLTFIVTHQGKKFRVASSTFSTSISTPAFKKERLNSKDNAIKLMKSNTSKKLEEVEPKNTNASSVIELFPFRDKKVRKVEEDKKIDKNVENKLGAKPKESGNRNGLSNKEAVVLCHTRPEYWWDRAYLRNDERTFKKCNCHYCKTMSKYLPQIDQSIDSITDSSGISNTESSEVASLEYCCTPNNSNNSEESSLNVVDPLYIKLMDNTPKEDNLVQLLKYEPHICSDPHTCEKCRNALQNISNSKNNRSETDLNFILKLKDHKHEVLSNQNKKRSEIKHDYTKAYYDCKKTHFRKIKISTTRIISKTRRLEIESKVTTDKKSEIAKIEENPIPADQIIKDEKKIKKADSQISLKSLVNVPKKPRLNGGNMMKLINTKFEPTSSIVMKKNDRNLSIFGNLRNALTLLLSFNFKILDFITFGKLRLNKSC